jgi:hypothetical protein
MERQRAVLHNTTVIRCRNDNETNLLNEVYLRRCDFVHNLYTAYFSFTVLYQLVCIAILVFIEQHLIVEYSLDPGNL